MTRGKRRRFPLVDHAADAWFHNRRQIERDICPLPVAADGSDGASEAPIGDMSLEPIHFQSDVDGTPR
jgi:hypothetical protein